MDKTRDFHNGDRVIVKNGTNRLDLAYEGRAGTFTEYSHPRRYARLHLDGDPERTKVLIHPDNVELLTAAPEPKAPAAGTTISTLLELCAHFGADEPEGLSASVCKAINCDAWILFQLPDRSWGRDVAGVRRIIAFRLGSIAGGSNAEFACDPLTLPCLVADVDSAIAWLAGKTSAASHKGTEEVSDPSST